MAGSHADSFFTENELKVLEKNLALHGKIIDSMTDDGTYIPSKVGDIRVLKEVMESENNRVIEMAKLRLKHQENANAGNSAELAAELLKAISKRGESDVFIPRGHPVEISDKDTIDVTIVAGELEINPQTLTLDDIED